MVVRENFGDNCDDEDVDEADESDGLLDVVAEGVWEYVGPGFAVVIIENVGVYLHAGGN